VDVLLFDVTKASTPNVDAPENIGTPVKLTPTSYLRSPEIFLNNDTGPSGQNELQMC
jgi:hypothetical protein